MREKYKNIIEAALFASTAPLTLEHFLELFIGEEKPEKPVVRQLLAELQEDYKNRGIGLVELTNGYQFQANTDLAPWLQRLWEEEPQKYSRALLEILALIAYRQPITRGEIADIRGVMVSTNIIKTLEEREWIRIVGHKDVPGRPALYSTTKIFLNDFGLKTLDELPALKEM